MSLFDRYVMVDWSAANRPCSGTDSVWICCLGADGECASHNPRTRGRARKIVRDLLVTSAQRRERVLVGFDFPFGYPVGLAAALGLEGEAWHAIWDLLTAEIADDPETNESNRFEIADALNRRLAGHAAFWGRPGRRLLEHLPVTRDVTYRALGATPGAIPGAATGTPAGAATGTAQGTAAGLAEWRVVEQLLHAQGQRPHSVWKLLGAGSVGSQALTGIPVVAALRDDPTLAAFSRVWPFDLTSPGLPRGEPAIVHAEVWPSMYEFRQTVGSCTDEKQVRHLAGELCRLDRAGALADLMGDVPQLSEEEGWILGVQMPAGSDL